MMAGRGVKPRGIAFHFIAISGIVIDQMSILTQPNAERILSELADVAERDDRQARVESIQAQNKVLEQQRLATQADARFARLRRQHPYATLEQVAAMLDREPEQCVDAAQVNAIQI
jgi:hypothetical protein